MSIEYSTKEGSVKAASNINFTLEKAKVLGLAGESGSGKTTIALALLRLLPSNAILKSGSVFLDGQNILELPENALRKEIRWKRISLVSQAAMNALNPVFRVGEQIKEAILAHSDVSDKEAEQRVKELLEEVGISQERYASYPHELSGGMRQRAIIAMALALNPDIVIADEPTTALDVIVQAQILLLLKRLQTSKKLSMILITHDLSLIAEMCDNAAIIYAGQIVEYASTREVFRNPSHPYTMGLMAAIPKVYAPKTRLASIAGSPPDLINLPRGCKFASRCKFATQKCVQEEPPLEEISPGHFSKCWYAREIGQ
ncbi:dipeptide/oligopeptide/nickel ABC transporter ATP-binding protein [Candidatus Marsarchaeota G1 archaeon OSP_D]|uniref:Dipeptide/oligopeptide/nickel ABC transporter ATP-binding protein n=2 Tax=Candidatus Marsarchaeota group 1 TaxID=2203770 RepID=A0A2R6A9V9_9ARCH|nr:MAG: dipeptide/oligopeptide/nickel ABC transporter ATP-binding protein [Candidatus Marsarchaeota G1 archaeon OSP_D]PSN88809.1 MAG: dipeptide/oligopeptide/nickel ABC transporter ATP-binding protein [Candidatus Marsarchaeota G1 archaeon OSP_C]